MFMGRGVMKKLLLIVCFFQLLFSEISVLDLKNSYSCLQGTDNEMLSPLVGAISWHSDWMKIFYRFGNPETACVKLARALFYYNEQTEHFAITKSMSSFAHYLAKNSKVDVLIGWYVSNKEKLSELSREEPEIFEKELNEWLSLNKSNFFPEKDFKKARRYYAIT